MLNSNDKVVVPQLLVAFLSSRCLSFEVVRQVSKTDVENCGKLHLLISISGRIKMCLVPNAAKPLDLSADICIAAATFEFGIPVWEFGMKDEVPKWKVSVLPANCFVSVAIFHDIPINNPQSILSHSQSIYASDFQWGYSMIMYDIIQFHCYPSSPIASEIPGNTWHRQNPSFPARPLTNGWPGTRCSGGGSGEWLGPRKSREHPARSNVALSTMTWHFLHRERTQPQCQAPLKKT